MRSITLVFTCVLVALAPARSSAMEWWQADRTVCADGGHPITVNCDRRFATDTYIRNAPDGTTIGIGPGTQKVSSVWAPNNVTIIGAGASQTTIATTVNNLITVTNGKTVTLRGVTILAPTSTNYRCMRVAAAIGGAINTLHLDGVRATACRAPSGGALIVERSAVVSITNSEFVNNRALGTVSQAEQGGSHISVDGGQVTILSSLFRDGLSNGDGGAIRLVDASGLSEVSVSDGTFLNNQAAGNGGAIQSTGSSVSINGTTFTNNRGRSGGALSLGATNLTLNASWFWNNQATALDANGTGGAIALANTSLLDTQGLTFGGNRARLGGAIYGAGNSQAHLRNSIFDDNEADGHIPGGRLGSGGAIAWDASTIFSADYSAFHTNWAEHDGGVIAISSSTFSAIGTGFYGNQAGGDGGVIASGGAIVDMQESTGLGNQAGGYGGFLAQSDGEFWLTDVELIGNRATYGGAVAALGYTATRHGAIERTNLLDNLAVIDGGALYFDTNGPTPRIENAVFQGNMAEDNGGAIWGANRGDWVFTQVDLVDNRANTGAGGGLHWVSGATGSLDWVGGAATRNVASTAGGALHLTSLLSSAVRAVSFTDNSADNGGAMWVGDTQTLAIQHSTFCANNARGASSNADGGALFVVSQPPPSGGTSPSYEAYLANNVFDGNQAGGSGGAVRTLNGTLIAHQNHVLGNGAGLNGDPPTAGHGGGFSVVGEADVRNNLFGWTTSGDAFTHTPVGGSVLLEAHNAYFNNANGDITSRAPHTTSLVGVDPQLTDYTAGNPCSTQTYMPQITSALLNQGDPSLPGPHDIGAFGGPDCVPFEALVDADLDGFGDIGAPMGEICSIRPGFSYVGGDCDDTSDAVYPGAPEICDGRDNNCNGLVDDDDTLDPEAGTDWFFDADGDGFGDPNVRERTCIAPAGYIADSSDCDDTNAAINPAAPEVCDGGIDNNCSGNADDDDPTVLTSTQTDWFVDNDNDGFGAAGSSSVRLCLSPAGRVADNTDCNDNNAAINPAATEVCDNGVDNNCTGAADDNDPTLDPSTRTIWYLDADNDGFPADPLTEVATSCARPPQSTANGTAPFDCDDARNTVYPGAPKQCNGVDNDCDGIIDDLDDEIPVFDWFGDADGDGFGDPLVVQVACSQPAAHVANADDCDDTDVNISPAATEICDGIDNNCSGLIDDDDPALDLSTAVYWYPDFDNDGFGSNAVAGLQACVSPATGSWSLLNTDCDDNSAATNPNATELCNGFDNNCNGIPDDNPVDGLTFWLDNDGDGFGDPANEGTFCLSNVPVGYLLTGDPDCDDTRDDIFPGATEVCDGVDNNCSGFVDDDDPELDLTTATTFFRDADGDDAGDPLVTVDACVAPNGYVNNGDDCDDTDASLTPFDNDGDGASTCDGDCDDDDPALNINDVDADGVSTCDGDCDDNDSSVGAPDGHVLGEPADCTPPEVEVPHTPRPHQDPPTGPARYGCGCDQGRSPTGALWLGAFAVLLARRRQRGASASSV